MVAATEVAEMLRAVARDELKVQVVNQTWNEAESGNVQFKVADWAIWVFNDCGDFDYIDRVIAPDGRVGEFDNWWPNLPEYGLSEADYEAMESAFLNAEKEIIT